MNENALMPVDADLPVLTDDRLLAVADAAEKRIDAMVKIKKLALKMTNPHDWTNQGDRPYLQASGSEKVGRLFGISWRIDEPVFEKEEDGHFSYTYKGYFTLGGVTIEAIGTRSSRDGFFKKYDGKGEDRKELPPSMIDKGDVKKSAYTNLLGNGITRILGLRNLTWEDLLEFAGITKDQVSSVDFKKNGKKHDRNIKSEGAQTATIAISDIRKQTGKNKQGQPWTKYIIKNGNAEYGTFSETVAQVAKEAKEAGLQVEVTYVTGKYGNDIESLKKVEPTDEQMRDPGQEG